MVDLDELREQHNKQGTVMLLPRQADALIVELEALREVAKAARKAWNSAKTGDKRWTVDAREMLALREAGFAYDELMRGG